MPEPTANVYIRMSGDLRKRLQRQAVRDKASLNATVIAVLEAGLPALVKMRADV